MKSKHLACIVSTVMLTCAFADQPPRLSSEALRQRVVEIKKIVKSQAKVIGHGVESPIKSEFGTPIQHGVVFRSGDLNVTLDPVAGRVLSLESMQTARHFAEKPKLNEEQALSLAEEHVRMLGASLQMSKDIIHSGYDPSTGRWNFAWQRRIGKYPFPEETIFISVNDFDGTLAAFRDRTTGRECLMDPIIDEAKGRESAVQAIKTVHSELLEKDYVIVVVGSGKLQIAYPNSRYQTQQTLTAHSSSDSPQPRLVYNFNVTITYAGSSNLRKVVPPASVWVDALTGSVVGGL